MSYIGKTPTVGNFQVCDAISVVNNQAAYTMQVGSVNVSPESANHMIVSLNGVIQKPTDAFTVSGSTITFASNLVTNDVINFIQILGNVLDLGVPSDATVSTAKIVDGAVTSAKLGTGDMTFSNGNLVFGTAGKGVHLGVTSATAANLLDDYEEGTFTPTFTSTSASFSYSQQHGFYTKIGRLVTVNIFIRAQSSGTTSNALRITALPFTSTNSSAGYYASVYFGQIESIDYPAGALEIIGSIASNNTQIYLQYSRDNAGSLNLPASAIDGATSNGFMVSVTYMTN